MLNSLIFKTFVGALVWGLLLCLDRSSAVLIDASTTNFSTSTYDYIISGCGTSGLVLAARLTEDVGTTVLCLEAGSLDQNEDFIRYPVYIGVEPPCAYEWCLTTAPQPQLDGQLRRMPMGKGVGGGSLINGMLWNRGGQIDYENWAKLSGDPGWSWAGMLPYFKKSETFTAQWYAGETANLSASIDSFDLYMHGSYGPTQVSYPEYLWPSSSVWFEALEELNIAKCIDPNDGSNAGGYFLPLNIHPTQQTRADARTTYYDPACRRPNFNVAVNAQLTRIIFEDDAALSGYAPARYPNISAPVKPKTRRQETSSLRATAVELAAGPNAPRQTVFARREVILAAGAVHTPQLLEVSGIGAADLLTSLSISVRQDLPGVGNNLQDHAMINLDYRYANISVPTPETLITNATFYQAAQQEYMASRTGPWTAKPSTAVAFPSLQQIIGSNDTTSLIALASLEDSSSYLPPTHTHTSLLAGYAAQLPLLLNALLNASVPSHEILNDNSGGLDVALMRPASRGTVHITSSDPFIPPAINPNWLSHPLDMAIMQRALLFNQRLLTTTSLSRFEPTFYHVPFDPSPSDLDRILRTGIGTEFHASGTAAMMPRELGGVVDSNLTVYGTSNLRIVDASIFPIIPGAHLQAVVYAVAEKAADITRGRGVGDAAKAIRVSEDARSIKA